MTEKTQFPR